jgi:hypothetical protein
MLSQEAIQKILAIDEEVDILPEDMADKLNITFYPYKSRELSKNILDFKKSLQETFLKYDVNIVPYEEALMKISLIKILKRFFKIVINNISYILINIFSVPSGIYINFGAIKNLLRRERIKSGISVVALGENETGNLPMDKTSSFTKSSVVTILDWPEGVKEDADFQEHFDVAMNFFAHHMTNIVIAVNDNKWLLYNFNASHPIYSRTGDFDKHVLEGLIPKIVAPIRPVKFDEFEVQKNAFDVNDEEYEEYVEDLAESGSLLEDTGLYPPGKKIEDLPFRNDFYHWIGKIHLDHRNGMSYGFLARQMPTKLPEIITIDEVKNRFKEYYTPEKDYFVKDEEIYILFDIPGKDETICFKVPDVWTLSQRSGSNKTNMDSVNDLINLGLVNGRMILRSPVGSRINSDYKTSFDTKVILANAVGNAIVATISKYLDPKSELAKQAEEKGFSITHWHGYFNPTDIPKGWHLHGLRNPNVSCSSPQSAIYSLGGKIQEFWNAYRKGEEFKGDIHVEPHHGTNMVYYSLKDFSDLIHNNPKATVIGNKYLDLLNS